MPHVHFALDQLLIDEAVGGNFARGRTEVGLLAVFEGRQTDAQVDFAIRDDFVADCDGDAVYDYRERRESSEETEEQSAHQKACPIEKKNWK
jgi:hypothetical protein